MSDQDDRRDDATPEAPGPTGDGMHQEPRGNPETDQEALDKGREVLERVKPY